MTTKTGTPSTRVRNPLTGEELDLGIPGIGAGWEPTPLGRSRIAIVGKSGTGKSTLLHSGPKTLVLDTELGGRTVACPQAFRFPANGTNATLAHYKEAAQKLIYQKATLATNIETVGVDTLDSLAGLFAKDICARHRVDDVGDACGGYGKGWSRLTTEVFAFLDSLHDAGFGVAVLAHVNVDVIRTKSGDVLQQNISLTQKLRHKLVEWADHILWLESSSEFSKDPGTGKMAMVPVKKLRTASVSGNFKGDQKENIKSRLPLPETLIIPPQHGWAHLSLAFDEAINVLTSGYIGTAPQGAK
jgi:hypothetical protein